MNKILKLGVFVIILIRLFSCKTMADKEKIANLEPSVLQFYEQIKWFRGNIAKNYVLPALRSNFLDNIDLASRKIKISEIKIIRITPLKNTKIAKVKFRVVWFPKNSNIVKETLMEDKWISVKNVWFKSSSKILDGEKVPYVFNKK